MKNRNVVLFSVFAALTILGTACNKGNSGGGGQAPPPPEKKVTVSTFAGDGTDGYLNGGLLSAKFNTPIDVAATPDGVVFVSDYKSHRIRKISGGQVSLFAGDGNWGEINGAGDVAEFKDPYRIEVDAAGNVYVLDQNNPHIRMITREGF